MKSFGNKLSTNKINNINTLDSLKYIEKIIDPVINSDNIDIPLTITNNDDSDDNNQTTLEL